MTRLRSLAFLVFGTLLGGALMLFVVTKAGAGSNETGQPNTVLPFHIHACQSARCLDPAKIPDDVEPPPTRSADDDRDVISNMSVNGGGNVQDYGSRITFKVGTKRVTTKKYLAITIPEDKAHNDGRRMQTLYVVSPGGPNTKPFHRLVTCDYIKPTPSNMYPMCSYVP